MTRLHAKTHAAKYKCIPSGRTQNPAVSQVS